MTSTLDLTPETLREALEAREVSFLEEPNGLLYVTGLELSFPESVCGDTTRLAPSTYRDFAEGVPEIEALRCAHCCNTTWAASQFSVNARFDRLVGEQVLPLGISVDATNLLEALESFAAVFQAALRYPRFAGLSESFSDEIRGRSECWESCSRLVH